MTYIGKSVRRREDRRLLIGAGNFVGDLRLPGCLDASFLRSHAAHGFIRHLDTDAARRGRGVAGVFTDSDLALPSIAPPSITNAPSAMKRPVLASEKVRFAGEAVAMVVAADRYLAEDAAERCVVGIDPIEEPVLDPERAEAGRQLFEGLSNLVSVRSVGTDVEEVLADAPITVEARYEVGRVVHTSLEGRAIAAIPTPGGALDLWCSHQAPHRLRTEVADALGMDASAVQVVSPDVGGAFGGKSQTYPEYVAVAAAALRLERPVRWVEDRREAFYSACHGRGQMQSVRLAADLEGKFLALDISIVADLGAYPHFGEPLAGMSIWMLSGCYAIPRLHGQARAVVTNKVPTAAYRGAGRPEAAHAVERTVDLLARRLGLDPADIRRRNYIAPESFPYKSPTGAVYDSGRYEDALNKALELADYRVLREQQARQHDLPDAPLLGIGISSYVERSGGQPGTKEYGRVEINGERVVARSGTAAQGQGHLTALAQIVASALDVSIDHIDVVQGDTREVAEGTGTFGSRSIQVGGGALHEACLKVQDAAAEAASAALGLPSNELSYSDGRFVAAEGSTVTIWELAKRQDLAAEVRFSPPQAFPFGTHLAVVEVDRITGITRLAKLIIVDDCGVVLNPLLAEGQAIGSAVQGIGQALYEAMTYRKDGMPESLSLIDYSLPTLAVVPDIVSAFTCTPNPNVPLGTKGAGEAGCIGVPPAIANAISDALDGRGATIPLPLSGERVWVALGEP